MEEAIKTLDDGQFEFIKKEFGVEKDAVLSMSESEIDDLYEKICDIEVHEAVAAGNDPVSERGEIAASIVTILGAIYAEEFRDEEDDSETEKQSA